MADTLAFVDGMYSSALVWDFYPTDDKHVAIQ